MKKLLLISICFAFAIVVPVEVKVMPTGDAYVVADVEADVDADTPPADSTGKDEKRQNESLEKRKPTESKDKSKGKDEKRQNEPLEKRKPTESNWKINVLPRPENLKSPIERKEDQFHLPPDRF
jgi:hypothetical protein